MTQDLPKTLWAFRPATPKAPGSESWTPIEVSVPLSGTSEGGTARILRIVTPGFETQVAKIFFEHALPHRRSAAAHEKLLFLARFRLALTAGHQGQAPARPYVVWPDKLLYAEWAAKPEALVGFTMPVVEEAQPLTTFITPRHRARFFRHASADAAYWLAGRIAECVGDLHGREKPSGILITDLTPRNILVSPDLTVRFIDADSFQYRLASGVHRSMESTPGFRAPRIAAASRAQQPLPVFEPEDDAYALAILLFHVLVDGAHPFRAAASFEVNGVQPDEEENMLARRFPYVDAVRMAPPKIRLQTWQKLPDRVKAAFEEVFAKGAVVSPRAWAELLAKARIEANSPMRPKPASKTLQPPPRVSLVAAPKPAPPSPITNGLASLLRSVTAAMAPAAKPIQSEMLPPAKAGRPDPSIARARPSQPRAS